MYNELEIWRIEISWESFCKKNSYLLNNQQPCYYNDKANKVSVQYSKKIVDSEENSYIKVKGPQQNSQNTGKSLKTQ